MIMKLNDCKQGLLHIANRHLTDFIPYIPMSYGFKTQLMKFKNYNWKYILNNDDSVNRRLERYIGKLENSKGMLQSHNHIKLICLIIYKTDFVANLTRLQIDIWKFVNRNVTIDNFNGKSANLYRKVRICFRIDDESELVVGPIKSRVKHSGTFLKVITMYLN